MFQSDLFPTGEQMPAVSLAFAIGTRIAALLAAGRHLTRVDISGLFTEETGVLDWGGAWTIDDYNNAVEIGALLWLRESSRIDLATNVHEAEARFDWIEAAFPARHAQPKSAASPLNRRADMFRCSGCWHVQAIVRPCEYRLSLRACASRRNDAIHAA